MKRRRFFSQLISKAPSFSAIAAAINPWSLTWLILVVLGTLSYGFFYEKSYDGELWPWLVHLWPAAAWTGLILGLVFIYIYDKWQKEDPVQRIFPVIIWGRKFMVKLGPLLRQYLFLNDQEETPFNRITRNWVSETSRGVRNTIGFGTQVDMDRIGSMIVLPVPI